MKTIMIMDATAKELTLRKKQLKEKFLKSQKRRKWKMTFKKCLKKKLFGRQKKLKKVNLILFELTHWTKDIFTTREEEIAREVIERLSTFLRKLGYVVNDFHEYTQSWKTRSGKFGYLFFRLPREGEE